MSSAYVETYEGTSYDFPGPDGCYACCGDCDWQGPHREEHGEGQRDADGHRCRWNETTDEWEIIAGLVMCQVCGGDPPGRCEGCGEGGGWLVREPKVAA